MLGSIIASPLLKLSLDTSLLKALKPSFKRKHKGIAAGFLQGPWVSNTRASAFQPPRGYFQPCSSNSRSIPRFSSWLNLVHTRSFSSEPPPFKLVAGRNSSLASAAVCQELPAGMTVTSPITLVDGNLVVDSVTLLSDVPKDVFITSDLTTDGSMGAFISVKAKAESSYHLLPLGVLSGLRFMCCFRFKLWWMTQRMGNNGNQIPCETQFMLVELKSQDSEDEPLYAVLLPIIDSSFRASLQGNAKNELELCLESGDSAVKSSEFFYPLFLLAGSDPFEVVSNAVRAVETRTQSFLHREKKKCPAILDYFGFCTWDAFYTDVSTEGIHQALSSLSSGGTPAKFLIIDDGWQCITKDLCMDKSLNVEQSHIDSLNMQFCSRLTDIKENEKFRKLVNANNASSEIDTVVALGDFVKEVKAEHDLKYIYVWHALLGYWGGVKPLGLGVEHYESKIVFPTHTPSILFNNPDMALDALTLNGLGIIHPSKIFDFYNEMHSYLAKAGIDGVKVDVQSILETLGSGFGGRVEISKIFQGALEKSVALNFPDNGIIACMSHSSDEIYTSKQTAIMRACEDFWPDDPGSHTIHIASVAYNSFFLGEFMQPDWDMFHSLHPAGYYHAAARAISGSPVYVSDKPGRHDFELLKKLVLPDGSILRALHPGRPTLDSLFSDPARDNKSALKIWNMNKCGGVIGAFNCQGAGWCKVGKRNAIHDISPDAVTFSIKCSDIPRIKECIGFDDWNGDVIVYTQRTDELIRLPNNAALPFSLEPKDFEIFTFAPIKVLEGDLSFAPVGLTNMFNTGGAILAVDYSCDPLSESQPATLRASDKPAGARPLACVSLSVRGCGDFIMWSDRAPTSIYVDGRDVPFDYSESQRISFHLDFVEGLVRNVLVVFSF